MLGIRRFHGVAIDLFQGELRLFACDAALDVGHLTAGLAEADAKGKRHIAVTAAGDPDAAFRLVQAHLEGRRAGGRGVQRISFVLHSLEQYYAFQDALFRTFPDEA